MTASAKVRVLSIDDHPLFRAGVAAIIDAEPDMAIVAYAATGREGIEHFRVHQPDVTLLDIRLPDRSGIDILISILSEFRTARIIILTNSEGDAEIRRALEAGACGYVLKSTSASELTTAIRSVHAGKRYIPTDVSAQLAEHLSDQALTAREVEVLTQLCGGNRNRDIALSLSISEETVKLHVSRIMEKLGARDRTHAVAIAARRGIVQL